MALYDAIYKLDYLEDFMEKNRSHPPFFQKFRKLNVPLPLKKFQLCSVDSNVLTPNCRSSRLELFCKIAILKYFAKLPGMRQWWWSPNLAKSQACNMKVKRFLLRIVTFELFEFLKIGFLKSCFSSYFEIFQKSCLRKLMQQSIWKQHKFHFSGRKNLRTLRMKSS